MPKHAGQIVPPPQRVVLGKLSLEAGGVLFQFHMRMLAMQGAWLEQNLPRKDLVTTQPNPRKFAQHKLRQAYVLTSQAARRPRQAHGAAAGQKALRKELPVGSGAAQ